MVTIEIVKDQVVEALEETFTVLLSLLRSDETVVISPSSLQMTIIDSDEPKPGQHFSLLVQISIIS